jgi:dihydrofolate synthase/folylpolyglutamate synthase
VHWGLERTLSALASLGNPQARYPTIHVGGTNGKGSVVTTLASVLARSGLRTGGFTSPHLCSFRERVVVNGHALSEQTLLQRAAEVSDAVVRYGLTFFEAVTVLGFHAFAREEVDIAVIEVGLGGRLDATNVLEPLVSAVTNVDMDHAEYLGDTRSKIAAEKGGIIKRGVPFVTAETSGELVALLRAMAAGKDAPFHSLDPAVAVHDLTLGKHHTAFRLSTRHWGDVDLVTPLVGRHQAANAALAVRVLEQLPSELRPDLAALVDGIASVTHPGRDQIEEVGGRSWLFDVAHNTAGIHSLVDTLERLDLPRPRVALVGVLGDKDWRTMLPPLFSRMDEAVLTQPPSAPPERRWDPQVARDAVGAVCPIRVEAHFGRALERARAAAGEGTVIVTGSCHTVGSALSVLGLEPLRDQS